VPAPCRLVEVPAGRVYVRRAGAGRTLVLVHGYLVSQHDFRAVLPALEQRFDVVAVDLPGFGESDRPPPARFDYRLASQAGVLRDVMDALHIRRATVWGHSMGGGVALALAARHPERVERLVLEDAAVYPLPLPVRGRLALLPGVGEAIFHSVYTRRDLGAHLRQVHRDPRIVSDGEIDFYWERFNRPGGRAAAYAALRALASLPESPDPPAVAAPAVVVWGEEDTQVPLAHGRRLAAQLRGAPLEVIPACGHAPHHERPDELLRALVPLLEPETSTSRRRRGGRAAAG
jgi:pimeloyl-ACP methyl ester carboxylesterase